MQSESPSGDPADVRMPPKGDQSRILEMMAENGDTMVMPVIEFRLGKPGSEFACDICSLIRDGYISQDGAIVTGDVMNPMVPQYRLTEKARDGLPGR